MASRLRNAVGLAERDGLLVRDVAADSPAARAGVRRATCSFARDRTELRRHEDLFAVLGTSAVAISRLGLVRGADELEVTVTF